MRSTLFISLDIIPIMNAGTMEELIPRLRAYGEPNPPCTPERLDALAAELGCELEPDLLALYADHDGIDPTWGWDEAGPPLWLMPVDEVIRMYRILQDPGLVYFWSREMCAFWSDDQSNYAAVYMTGPFRGKVCFLSHDSSDNEVPMFRSVRSFCRELLRSADEADDGYVSYTDLECEHPAPATAPPADVEADLALALHCAAACRDAEARDDDEDGREQQYFADCAIHLLPIARRDLLDVWARDESPTLCQRANARLKALKDAEEWERGAEKRRERAAAVVARTAELILSGPHGKQSDARKELLQLLRGVDRSGLAALGMEVKEERKGYQYRAAPGAPWVFLKFDEPPKRFHPRDLRPGGRSG